MTMNTLQKTNPTSMSFNSKEESGRSCLYKAIWQVCIIASTNEWPLLLLGLSSTLVFSKTNNWLEIKKWWFNINNWTIAIFLTLLYTIVRHNVELNSLVFFAKRIIIISLSVISLNYLLKQKRSAKPIQSAKTRSKLIKKVVYITSQISISLFILAPFITNQGADSDIFDELLNIQGASQVLALIFLATAASLPIAMQASKKDFASYCIFTLTSTMLFNCSQSRMTAGVMLTSMIYILGYIHKNKVIDFIGKTVTKLWIVYYAVFLPICTIAAPVIHDKAKWLAKILYTATGSRYTLTWSANLWHENGLNFSNNDKASSIFSFLSNAYFDTDFTSFYGHASEFWKHDADIFVPGGPHSIFISTLLQSKSMTFLLAGTWILITLFVVLLIREYREQFNLGNLSRDTIVSLEIFMALILSVITAESISLTLYMLTFATYLLLLTNNAQGRPRHKNNDFKPKVKIYLPAHQEALPLSSPIILVTPLIIYGGAYLLAQADIFRYFFKA